MDGFNYEQIPRIIGSRIRSIST